MKCRTCGEHVNMEHAERWFTPETVARMKRRNTCPKCTPCDTAARDEREES